MLQGLCFLCRLNPFNLNNYHVKFQLNPIREGFKKKKMEFSSLGGGFSDGGSIFKFLKQSLIFVRFLTIFDGFLSSIFQFLGGGGPDQKWKIPVFFFFF